MQPESNRLCASWNFPSARGYNKQTNPGEIPINGFFSVRYSQDGHVSIFGRSVYYATASVAEVTPRIQESVYLSLVGNARLFAGAFATVFLLALLIPVWG